ncbi:MAG: 6-phosphogluconolactonase [Actinomycetota bacterium]|nr:MAG: 6-phosphogluconolactonase [Actinomycetota bacterium]
MSVPEVVVFHDAAELAAAAAGRLVVSLVEAQAAREVAHVVLTGGGIGTATLAAVRDTAASDAVDWSRVEVWWGDERFLPAGHPDRNETGARSALLDHVGVAPQRVHPMPASDGPDGDDVAAAAARYAELLRAAAVASGGGDQAPVPRFDVLLLGVGPDAHVASLFPELPALHDTRSVCAVHGAPKPPPTRITLTAPSIRAAAEVWLLAAGESKATAMRLALSADAGEFQVPAAGARGAVRTLALLDAAAARLIPRTLPRPASP